MRGILPRALALIVPILFVIAADARAQGDAAEVPAEPEEHAMVPAGALAFTPLEVPGFDSGMRIAAIHGDLSSVGDYTIRLAFPDGYRFPSHWHPRAEHVTVLEGTLLLAMDTGGEKVEPERYAPGAFLYLPAEDPHYGGAEGETVIQLHGEGPFEIYLTETSD